MEKHTQWGHRGMGLNRMGNLFYVVLSRLRTATASTGIARNNALFLLQSAVYCRAAGSLHMPPGDTSTYAPGYARKRCIIPSSIHHLHVGRKHTPAVTVNAVRSFQLHTPAIPSLIGNVDTAWYKNDVCCMPHSIPDYALLLKHMATRMLEKTRFINVFPDGFNRAESLH